MKNYHTQMEAAKMGIITPEMEVVAKKEYMEPEKLRELVAKGEVAIPCNINHKSISPEGIGSGLRTKINVKNNTGLAAFFMWFYYDSNALEVVDAYPSGEFAKIAKSTEFGSPKNAEE